MARCINLLSLTKRPRPFLYYNIPERIYYHYYFRYSHKCIATAEIDNISFLYIYKMYTLQISALYLHTPSRLIQFNLI